MTALPDVGRVQRAQGCWLGQLAGDSLGSLVEFLSSEVIPVEYSDGVRDRADGGVWDTQAGQPTDDSEMALVLARALVREGRYDPAAFFAAYVHWYESGPFDARQAPFVSSRKTANPLTAFLGTVHIS